jgi:anti-anti-sigma factor
VVGERRGEQVIAHVRGEIDASNVRWVGAHLRALLNNRSEALTVDLSRTTYLDSAGIALLFDLAAELPVRRQHLRIVVADGSPVARVVSLTGLTDVVEIHPTLDAALSAH